MVYLLLIIIILLICIILFLWNLITKVINKSAEITQLLESKIEIFSDYENRINGILDLDLYSDEPHVMDFISIIKNTKIELIKTIESLSYNDDEDKK